MYKLLVLTESYLTTLRVFNGTYWERVEVFNGTDYEYLELLNPSIWIELDLGDDKPAMNYQVNDVAELEDRQSSYSQSLKLPFTPNNCRYFGFLDGSFTESTAPYIMHDCRLWASGSIIADKGSVLNLISVTDGFNIQIVSGFKNIFNLLENKPMSELALGYFPRTIEATLPANFPPEYEFAIASFTRGGKIYSPDRNPIYTLPFVYDYKILEALFSNLGYTWISNLDDYPEVQRFAKPIVNNLSSPESFGTIFDASSSINKPWQTPYQGVIYYLPTIVNNCIGFFTSFGVDGTTSESGNTFTAGIDCSIDLNISGTWKTESSTASVGRIVYIKIIKSLSDIVTSEIISCYSNYTTEYIPIQTPFDINQSIMLSKGDSVTIEFYTQWGVGWVATYCELISNISITNFYADTVPVYGLVEISKNLGFKNQADYFKSMLQELGLTVYIDHTTSTIYTYTMQKLYDNKSIAIDWSNKLHISKNRQTTFVLEEYGQINNILFKENSEDDVINSGSFSVDNTTLTSEVDLFTIDIESGKDYPLGSLVVANIPVFEIPGLEETPITLVDTELKEGSPHQIILSTETSQGNLHIANHITVQHLIDTYYSKLATNMLNKTKVLTEELFLEPSDIEAFQPFVPIYLKQYGAYFYVNKIVNFVENQITKVELIKL